MSNFFNRYHWLIGFLIVAMLGGWFLLSPSSSSTQAASLNIPETDNRSFFSPTYQYSIVNKSADLSLLPGDIATLSLTLKNEGTAVWFKKGNNPISLGASRPIDRMVSFHTGGANGWTSDNRIAMTKDIVYPGQEASFIFDIKAPEESGIYREFFAPLAEYKKWMKGEDIFWNIKVLDPKNPNRELKVLVDGTPEKYIKIKLKEQKLYAYDNGELIFEFATSTGQIGMDTPKGATKIYNKYSVAYSAPYELYMDNWMSISQDGLYGIHSLPYWLLRVGGRLYEGEDHLGKKVSHGCVRVGVEESKILYDWAEIGMPVIVED